MNLRDERYTKETEIMHCVHKSALTLHEPPRQTRHLNNSNHLRYHDIFFFSQNKYQRSPITKKHRLCGRVSHSSVEYKRVKRDKI